MWTEEDLTRDNFPATYDIIKNLRNFNKVSPYNKNSIVSDLMRVEIIYRHGGFYFDQNIMVLQKGFFDRYLKFGMVAVSFMESLFRVCIESSFFGAAQGYAPLGRVIDHRILSTRNFYSKKANVEAGPRLVSFAIEDEQDPEIGWIPEEVMYPHSQYYAPAGPNLCIANTTTR